MAYCKQIVWVFAALFLLACGGEDKPAADPAAPKPEVLPVAVDNNEQVCQAYMDSTSVRNMTCDRLAGMKEAEVFSRFDLGRKFGYSGCKGVTKINDNFLGCLKFQATRPCSNLSPTPECFNVFE